MAAVLYRIKAYLYPNLLTDDPGDYMARVISEQSLDIEELCELAVNRGRADVSAAAMQHGVSLFLKEMAYQLCNGYSVNTGYFTASPLIKGVFTRPDESFDPGKHRVVFRFRQGDILRDQLSSVEVEIMGKAGTGLNISQVTDIKTGSVNDLLTPNCNLKINGRKIKVIGYHEATGVYFVNQTSGESIRMDPTDLAVNKPSELIVIIPALASGTYKLQVTTQYSKPLLKKPRSVVFDKMLRVE
ncbi:MAG: DNA-binding domain-containing protein [Mangrovibacterium sp.]